MEPGSRGRPREIPTGGMAKVRKDGWVRLTPTKDDPGVLALKREKEQAREQGAAMIAALPEGPVTFAGFLSLCDEVDHRVSPTYPYSGVGLLVFRYYGAEMIERILPEVRRQHLRFEDDSGRPRMKLLNESGRATLPDQIDCVAIDDIFNSMGPVHDAWRKARDTKDRIEAIEWGCGFVTKDCMDALHGQFPRLSTTYIRASTASRRWVENESEYPGLRGLADGHSLYTVDYADMDGKAMALVIDPTIAQVDRSREYDAEVTAVPAEDLDTYLRLRYRTYPDKAVIKYVPYHKL